MRISKVVISDFRSIFPDDRGQPLTLELSEGMNSLVGRNNCGKSNVLRAISLALDPLSTIDPKIDLPVGRDFASPSVELTFELDDGEDEQELAEIVNRWRRAGGLPVNGRAVTIEVGVTYQVRADGGYTRVVDLLPVQRPGVGDAERDLILQQLFAGVRVVSIASGEGLDSFLEGNFRAVLHTVLSDRLRDEVEAAARTREDYIAGIEQRLLEPLRALLGERIRHLFQEIGGLALRPDVPDIEQTLARVAVSVTDAVETPLEAKGTGVRGGVLVALLNYLADNSSQGLVFLIEEPEAFLHPAAQEDLRDTLEEIAARPDITTIVSSHSPFIASRRPEGQVIALAKDPVGRTRVEACAPGDSDHAHLIGGLIRPATFEDLLKAAMQVPPQAKAVLIVEGDGDAFDLRLAARRAGRPELLEDLDIRPAGGASRLVLQAVVAREALSEPAIPVLVLLDNDEPGRDAARLLKGQKFAFDSNLVISYADVMPRDRDGPFPYEAEDLWPPGLIKRFIHHNGDVIVAGSKRRPDGAYHYDFELAAKQLLEGYLEKHVTAADAGLWVTLAELIRERAGLPTRPARSDPSAVDAPADGSVLVLTTQADIADYRNHNIVFVDETFDLPDDLTGVAFYVDGAIQPVVPAVRRVQRKVRFLPRVVEAMLRAGGDVARIGQFVAGAIDSGRVLNGGYCHVLVLSSEDAADTRLLDQPVQNTRTVSGRSAAWAITPRLVPLGALLAGVADTDELDALVADSQGAVGRTESSGEGDDVA